ncbi:hypothetical protein O6H91_17G000700 [Diphasiastrum complanatum]|nr:hypothetical protein O6H91_17G000700 [Diphasiastrum complanatum]
MICGTGCGFAKPKNEAADEEARTAATRKLIYAVGFCLFFMVVEIVGGILANSLAILTDAAHLLSDVAGFGVSLFAIWASSWQATARQTYGFHRVEILGALVSMLIIWLITGILVYQAVDRIFHSAEPVDGLLMFCIATMGLLVNIVMIFILGHDHGHPGHGHSHGEDHHGHSHRENDHSQHKHGHSQNDHPRDGHGHSDGEDQAESDHFDHAHSENDHGHKHVQSGPAHEQKDIANHDHSKHAHGHDIPGDLERNHVNNEDVDGFHNAEAENSELLKDVDKVDARSSENINVRGAYLHVFGDLVQSVGVMIAGALIWFNPEWKILDLICTLLFSLLVLGTTIKMLRDILGVLMESTPREIDATMLETGLLKLENVVAVHDLHIWAITLGKTLLACHVRIAPDANSNEVLQSVIDYCKNQFNISHVTVQVERD